MKRVLIAEHDTLYRDLIREWLEEGSVQSVYADSPKLVVADVGAVLIDVSCEQQARTTLDAWRRAYPHAVLVLVSGRFIADDMANGALAARLGVSSILAKPFNRAALWNALGHPAAPRSVVTPQS